ncbi:MAG: LL-diaminopimelate aminotransferase [Candidatus Saganbacteria bacterium]|nr:LL-diaminopimelate aminotransferase [Candidatus Saganbacteria bacterium]
MFEEAKRLRDLPTYVFDTTDKLKQEERAKGKDLIDLSMASPDFPTPPAVVEAMKNALDEPINHRYPSFDGLPEFRHASVKWCREQYKIDIDADKEIIPLIGSKEGLVHLAFAFIEQGDTTLVPLPAYPAHFRGTLLAGGTLIVMPTSEKTGYVPDLTVIDEAIANKARMMFLSYPTNPTGAVAPLEFFEKAVAFCKKHSIILIHDFAYAEIYFNGNKPHSLLEVHGAKDIAIEFHTLSKTFSMAGWRIGFVVGNRELIASLRKMKTNLDYGLFAATQKAGIAAMQLPKSYLDETRQKYQERRDVLIAGLQKLGWKIESPKGSMYVWIEVPKGYNSTSFFMELLKKAGVVVSPGIGFGDLGEGYVRIALIDTKERITEAINRMEKAGIKYDK